MSQSESKIRSLSTNKVVFFDPNFKRGKKHSVNGYLRFTSKIPTLGSDR